MKKIVFALFVFSSSALADPFPSLATGNGFGYQIFDTSKNHLSGFLDHPYRYLRPSAEDPHKEGPERRNLLESFSQETEDGPLEATQVQKIEFVEETNILRVASTKNERYFYSPYGLNENVLITLVHFPEAPASSLTTKIKFHLGASPKSPMFWVTTMDVAKIPGEKIERQKMQKISYWVETGKGQGALVYLPLNPTTSASCLQTCAATDLQLTLKETPGPWTGLAIIYVEKTDRVRAAVKAFQKWRADLPAQDLLQRSIADWRSWRKEPKASFKNESEKKIWRQSETVLRLSQVLEKNQIGRKNHGMLLASLPPGAWTTAWVRDGSYASAALSRMGHYEEARKSLNFFLEADPVGKYSNFVGGQKYRISLTRYFGNGEEEADYANQATPNIETDGWGLTLWAARQYVTFSGDIGWLKSKTSHGVVYDVLKNGIVIPLESQIESDSFIMKPDSSIWEVHQQNAKHYLYTTMTAARGLCDFAALAHKLGKEADHKKYSRLSEKIREAILKKFLSSEKFLLGAVERSPESDMDGSTLEAFTWGILPSNTDEVASKTIKNLEKLKTPSGGYKRMASLAQWELNEWFFIGARMANALWLNNRQQDGDKIFEMLVNRAAKNYFLIPEMYNSVKENGPLEEYAGSVPMSGYGAGIYVMSLLDRSGLKENQACIY